MTDLACFDDLLLEDLFQDKEVWDGGQRRETDAEVRVRLQEIKLLALHDH